jgi:hypothetical protein
MDWLGEEVVVTQGYLLLVAVALVGNLLLLIFSMGRRKL